MKALAPGDATVQLSAEADILEAASRFLGCGPLRDKPAHPFEVEEGRPVQIDGVSRDGRILVEAYARQGALKGAQFHKVARDILKLSLIKGRYTSVERAVIAFASQEARDSVRGWIEAAAAISGVELISVDIPAEQRKAILDAQRRQIMVSIAVGDVADDVDAIESYELE